MRKNLAISGFILLVFTGYTLIVLSHLIDVFNSQAIFLGLFAGTATGIGGLLVIRIGKFSYRTVGFSIGFKSGVMLIVAFNDLLLYGGLTQEDVVSIVQQESIQQL